MTYWADKTYWTDRQTGRQTYIPPTNQPDKTRQDITRRGVTRQDKTREYRQTNKTDNAHTHTHWAGQYKTRHAKTGENGRGRGKPTQYKTRQKDKTDKTNTTDKKERHTYIQTNKLPDTQTDRQTDRQEHR